MSTLWEAIMIIISLTTIFQLSLNMLLGNCILYMFKNFICYLNELWWTKIKNISTQAHRITKFYPRL